MVASGETGHRKPGDSVAGFLDLDRFHFAPEQQPSGVAIDYVGYRTKSSTSATAISPTTPTPRRTKSDARSESAARRSFSVTRTDSSPDCFPSPHRAVGPRFPSRCPRCLPRRALFLADGKGASAVCQSGSACSAADSVLAPSEFCPVCPNRPARSASRFFRIPLRAFRRWCRT